MNAANPYESPAVRATREWLAELRDVKRQASRALKRGDLEEFARLNQILIDADRQLRDLPRHVLRQAQRTPRSGGGRR